MIPDIGIGGGLGPVIGIMNQSGPQGKCRRKNSSPKEVLIDRSGEKNHARMQELAKLLGQLEAQLAICMRCGMCQAVCPLYDQTGLEADVARGKLALLEGLCDQLFDNPDGVSRRLERCLLCGSCQANCPSGVSVLEIFIKARAILAGFAGLNPAQRLVLRGMLARPELADKLFEWAGRLQKIFTRPASNILDTSCPRLVSPLLGGRHVKNIAARPFHRRLASLDLPRGTSGCKVAFFVGCLLDKLYPHTAMAVVTVLKKLGVGIFLPAGQGCCGIPALAAGDTDTFRRLARHNLRLLQGQDWDFLITACATCTWTISRLWPMLAGGRRSYEHLAVRTLDVSQFLVDKVGIGSLTGFQNASLGVTYHDPCHLKKSLGVSAAPRALIAAAGCRLVEMEKADSCCGMGGSFNLKYYRMSQQIGELKRKSILACSTEIVATSCPACMTQLCDIHSRAGDHIQVKHVIELLEPSL